MSQKSQVLAKLLKLALQVGLGGMCIYTLRQKGIRREYCGVRGANVEEVGATDIEETKLQTPVLRIYEASVVPCPQLRPTIVARSPWLHL